jgi:methionyl-tRNA formyltransferase
LRVIFAGTPKNAARTLEYLLGGGVEVVGVITRPDSKVGRNQILTPSPVALLAQAHNLPTLKTKKITDSEFELVQTWEPDLGVVVAFGLIFKTDFLFLPKHGWLNVHYSLLPKWPGAAPVQNSILAGDKETGVTIFRLDEGIDTGPILHQETTIIGAEETSGELLERLTLIGAKSLFTVIEKFEGFVSNITAQDIRVVNKVAQKPTRELAKIDWQNQASEICQLIRAMNPEPAAWCNLGDTTIRILRARMVDEGSISLSNTPETGRVINLEKRILIGCGGKTILELQALQPAGKTHMPAFDWYLGLRREFVVLS